jgi:hypothetical protein
MTPTHKHAVGAQFVDWACIFIMSAINSLLLRNPKFHYCHHKSPTFDPTLSHPNVWLEWVRLDHIYNVLAYKCGPGDQPPYCRFCNAVYYESGPLTTSCSFTLIIATVTPFHCSSECVVPSYNRPDQVVKDRCQQTSNKEIRTGVTKTRKQNSDCS